MDKVTTVILKRGGEFHLATEKITPEDARRWADEGFHVFQLVARGNTWAFHCVNDSKVFTNLSTPSTPDSDAGRHEDNARRLLTIK